MGQMSSSGKNILVTSRNNNFTQVLDGATITIQNASTNPVTINVTTSNTDIVANVKTFVDNYNKFRQKLNDDTAYNTTSDTKSVLTGDNVALQLDYDMSQLISGTYLNSGSIQSLGQIGISLKNDGTIQLDENKLNDCLTTNSDAVKQLFTAKDNGVSAQFSKVIERLAGPDTSLIELRNSSLQETIDRNQEHIDAMNTMLDNQQTRLLTQFYQMELNLAKLQSNLSALNSIQWMLDTTSTSNSLFNNSSSSSSSSNTSLV